MVSLTNFQSFGFSGSRSLSQSSAGGRALLSVLGSLPAGGRVLVGCAGGSDAIVRAACPGARVFSVSGAGGGRGAFAARSVAFVRALCVSPSPVLFVFPSSACPAGLRPSASACACFAGFGSGSWASAALAVGLGVPVFVYSPLGGAAWLSPLVGCWFQSAPAFQPALF